MFECKLKTLNDILILRKILEKNLLWSHVSFVIYLVPCHIIDVKDGRMFKSLQKKKIQLGDGFQQSSVERY